ncbi:MAG TPA: hypothetical protein VK308_05300 [Pyrinomonadaceae bacterium]|nr:hypothetical protein [Pyrinomonadaceae bacterium]
MGKLIARDAAGAQTTSAGKPKFFAVSTNDIKNDSEMGMKMTNKL